MSRKRLAIAALMLTVSVSVLTTAAQTSPDAGRQTTELRDNDNDGADLGWLGLLGLTGLLGLRRREPVTHGRPATAGVR